MLFPILTPEIKKMPLYLASVGKNEHQELICRSTGMEFHQILFVTSGKGIVCSAEGTQKELAEGSCLFIEKHHCQHYWPLEAPFTTKWVTFAGVSTDSMLKALGLEGQILYQSGNYGKLNTDYEALYQVTRKQGNRWYETASVLLYQLIMDFAQRPELRNEENRMRPALEYMKRHFREEIELKTLAEQVGVSHYQFCRLFKKSCGMTPFAYLMQLRIQQAKYALIMEKGLTVAQIAERNGFHDASYFGAVFKKQEGMTPLEFRKRMR